MVRVAEVEIVRVEDVIDGLEEEMKSRASLAVPGGCTYFLQDII